MVSIGLCVFIGIISFIVGSFSGICMICMCVVGGSGDESGADSNIETLKKNTSRRLRVLAISDWDIVTVMDLADKTEKEFEIGQLQRVRRIKQHEGQ